MGQSAGAVPHLHRHIYMLCNHDELETCEKMHVLMFDLHSQAFHKLCAPHMMGCMWHMSLRLYGPKSYQLTLIMREKIRQVPNQENYRILNQYFSNL